MIKKVFVGLSLILLLLVPLVFTSDTIKDATAKGDKFEFQAEVNKLLSIIINSLYSNKDIFLRELISNASDALDKIRFASLTDKNALNSGTDLEIRIKADNDTNTLSIRDTGVGMTKEDLVQNLGTIARSGTKSFMEKLKDEENLNLIGQFGVGFYSAFLVADSVAVVTKNNADKQYIWESAADSTFTISEDPRGDTLGRGTEIILHLKDDASQYLNEETLKDLIEKYSEFIHFPIYLYSGKEIEKEVEEEKTAEESEDNVEESEEGSEDVGVEDEAEESAPKTVKETVYDWEQVNDKQPIWTRPTSEISDEEYKNFYNTMTKDYGEPLSWTHFSTEGDVSFKSLLYIPPRMNDNVFESTKQTGIKLYVRRVFITDEFYDLLPRWLNFLRGIVDSDDLPLNVSRETLQHSRLVRIIKNKLIKKALDLFNKLAAEEEDHEDGEQEESEDTKKPSYEEVWNQFGTNLRLGIIDDIKHRGRISKLLRYRTTKSMDKLVSLQSYVDRMKENQKDIYYITGESLESVKSSPYLDKLKAKDYEVVLMVDPIDEFVVQSLSSFDDHKLVNVAREGLKLDEDDQNLLEERKKMFEPLTKFLKEALKPTVEKVVVSDRVVSIPCMLSSGKWGMTANQERIMKAQALGDKSTLSFMKSSKVMEINPEHPLIRKMRLDVARDENLDQVKETAKLLFDTASLMGGFSIEDSSAFAHRIHSLVSSSVDEKELAKLEEELKKEEEKKRKEEEEAEEVAEEEEEEDETHDEL